MYSLLQEGGAEVSADVKKKERTTNNQRPTSLATS